MKFFYSILLLKVLGEVSSKQIPCLSTTRTSWVHVDFVKVCSMGFSAVINSVDATIAPNATITALDLNLNEEILFLPVKVATSFPKLIAYSAMFCSVKTISKSNFESLNILKLLWLHGNQIESIRKDTFNDLVSLEHLDLGE